MGTESAISRASFLVALMTLAIGSALSWFGWDALSDPEKWLTTPSGRRRSLVVLVVVAVVSLASGLWTLLWVVVWVVQRPPLIATNGQALLFRPPASRLQRIPWDEVVGIREEGSQVVIVRSRGRRIRLRRFHMNQSGLELTKDEVGPALEAMWREARGLDD